MKKNGNKSPKLTFRFRDEKEEQIKDIIDELARNQKKIGRVKSYNEFYITILRDYIRKTHTRLSLNKIIKIIDNELEQKEVTFSKTEIPTVEKWFYQNPYLGDRKTRKTIILQWIYTHFIQDLLLSIKQGGSNNIETTKKWENLLKDYGIVNYLHEIDQDALEKMFLDYLEEYFTLETRNGSDYYLVPQRQYVADIILELIRNMPQTHSKYCKEMLESYTTAIISPVSDINTLSKEIPNESPSNNILLMLDLMLSRYIEPLFEEFIENFEDSKKVLNHILSYCTEKELENIKNTEYSRYIYDRINEMDETVQKLRNRFITEEGDVKPYQPLESAFIKKLRELHPTA